MVTLGPALAGRARRDRRHPRGRTRSTRCSSRPRSSASSPCRRSPPEGERSGPGSPRSLDGLRFLRTRPQPPHDASCSTSIAMTFGQPRALFPAVGALLIGGGPLTVGILTAAGAVGTLASSVFSGRLGSVRRQGRRDRAGDRCLRRLHPAASASCSRSWRSPGRRAAERRSRRRTCRPLLVASRDAALAGPAPPTTSARSSA